MGADRRPLTICQFVNLLRLFGGADFFFLDLGLYENLPVFKASYVLLLNIYQFTGNFTREYKYTLGEKIKNETIK